MSKQSSIVSIAGGKNQSNAALKDETMFSDGGPPMSGVEEMYVMVATNGYCVRLMYDNGETLTQLCKSRQEVIEVIQEALT